MVSEKELSALEISRTRICNIVYKSSTEAAHEIGRRAEFRNEKSTVLKQIVI